MVQNPLKCRRILCSTWKLYNFCIRCSCVSCLIYIPSRMQKKKEKKKVQNRKTLLKSTLPFSSSFFSFRLVPFFHSSVLDIAKVFIHWDAVWRVEFENVCFFFFFFRLIRPIHFFGIRFVCKVSVSIDIDVCSSGGGGGFSAFKRHFGFAVIYRELTPKSYSMSPTRTYSYHIYARTFIPISLLSNFLSHIWRDLLEEFYTISAYKNGFIIHYSIAFINFSRNFFCFCFRFFLFQYQWNGKKIAWFSLRIFSTVIDDQRERMRWNIKLLNVEHSNKCCERKKRRRK